MAAADIRVDLERAEISNVREVPFNSNQTLPESLRRTWERMGDNVAMTHGYTGRQLRFSELLETVNRLAGAFHGEGLRQGQAVLVIAHNSLEVYLSLFAVWFAGCIAVLVNTSWPTEFISSILERRRIEFVIADGASMSLVTKLTRLPHTDIKKVFYTDDPLSIPAMMSFSSRKSSDMELSVTCRPDDVIFVAFTSGTTGDPKPVPVTHFSFLGMFATAVDSGLYGPERHALVWAPPYHIVGVTVTAATLLSGARIVVVPEQTAHMDPHQIAFVCQNHKVNSLIGCSDFIEGLLQENLRHRFEGITAIVTSGYPPDSGRLEEMRQFFNLGPEVRIAYGTTETIGSVLLSSQDESPPMRGVPLPHIKVRIVNSRNEAVAPGFEGEILIKGTFVVTAYWSGTTDDHEALDGVGQMDDVNFSEDGWFRTGDLGLYDEHGQVTVIGQMQDVILLGKHRIHCSVFEAFFLNHVAVREVKVVGIPRESGLEIIACIVPDPGTLDAVLLADLYDAIGSAVFPFNQLCRIFLFDDLPRTAWRRPSRRIIISQLKTTTL